MKRIIHHLRRQPEQTRRHILHILTVAMAVILAMLWVYSLGTNLASSDTKVKIQKDLEPLSVLKDSAVDGYNTISGSSDTVVE